MACRSAVLLFFSFVSSCVMAAGELDASFGTAGVVISGFSERSVTGQSLAIQPDGKIVVAGYSTLEGGLDADGFVLMRHLSDGTLDPSFGNGGRLWHPIAGGGSAKCVRLQTDGRIVVAGSVYAGAGSSFVVARYLPNGSADASFNGTGYVITSISGNLDFANSLVVQPDGKIVVAGTKSDASGINDDFVLVRYTNTGGLDSGFNGSGIQTTSIGAGRDYAGSIALQDDGKLIVAGSSQQGGGNDMVVARYTSSGIPDTTFSGDGIALISTEADDAGQSVAIQNDGKILLAGYSFTNGGSDFALLRLNSDGTRDASFGSAGIAVTLVSSGNDVGQSVVVQANGKIVVAGYSLVSGDADFAFARYTSNGMLDNTFSGVGTKTVPVAAGMDFAQEVQLQADGSIVGAGFSEVAFLSRFALVRLRGDAPMTQSQLWRKAYFGSDENAGPGADLNDPDGDGAVNLMEFALGTDPTGFNRPSTRPLLQGTQLDVYFTRLRNSAAETSIALESSESLHGTWVTEASEVPSLVKDGGIQEFKFSIAKGSAPKRFFRLRVKRVPDQE